VEVLPETDRDLVRALGIGCASALCDRIIGTRWSGRGVLGEAAAIVEERIAVAKRGAAYVPSLCVCLFSAGISIEIDAQPRVSDRAEENVSDLDRRERAVGRDCDIGEGAGPIAPDPLAGHDDTLQFDVLRDDG